MLEWKGMFHRVLVVTLFCSRRDMGWSQSTRKCREKNARLGIFTSRTTTRLLTGSSRGDCLDGALEDIAQFKRLHEIPISYPIQSEVGINCTRGRSSRVPNHAPVLDADIIKVFINEANLLDPSERVFLGPEDSSIGLHDLLHVKTNLGSWLWTVRMPT